MYERGRDGGSEMNVFGDVRFAYADVVNVHTHYNSAFVDNEFVE